MNCNQIDLLIALFQRGVELKADGQDLQCRSETALTPELTDSIKANKTELLRLLNSDEMALRKWFDSMLGRLNASCPQGFRLTSSNWQQLDKVESRVRQAWDRREVHEFLVSTENYERLALEIFGQPCEFVSVA